MPSVKIGTEKRSGMKGMNNPGPGSYNLHSKMNTTAPHYGFGTSTRKGMGDKKTPGPGAYNSNMSTIEK